MTDSLGDFVLDRSALVPLLPLSVEEMYALLDQIEDAKKILACAPDVYERVRTAVESSPLTAYYRVIEQPLLPDGQVLSIDPAVFELPPPEQVIDPEPFKPQHRCVNCSKPTYTPGYCTWCEVFAKAMQTRPPGLSPLITGLSV